MTRSAKIAGAVVAGLGVAFFGVAAALVYFAVDFTQGTQLAKEGYAAMAMADYDNAIGRFDAALRKNIGAYQRSFVYLNRGVAFNLKWHFDQAIGDFTEALRLNPALAEAYAGRGLAYQRKGDLEKAIVDLGEAIKRDPNSQSAYYNRGLVFYNKGEVDRALPDFDEAVRCSPDKAEPLLMRGLAYAQKNELDRALANFDGAITIDPKNAQAFTERGNLYGRKGEHAKSLHDLAEARRLAPLTTPTATNPQATVAGQHNRPPQLEVKPLPTLDATLLASGGKTYPGLLGEEVAAYEAGDFDRAIALCNQALAMDIAPAEASIVVMRRGNVYLQKNEVDKAMNDYEQALRLDPGNAAAYVNRALGLERKGEREDALKDLSEALRLNPRDVSAYHNRATIFLTEGNLNGALSDFAKVIELDPKDSDAHVGRAAVYLRQNENDLAIAECDLAIEQNPNSVIAYIERAKAHAQMKQYARASNDLEATAKLKAKDMSQAFNSVAWLRATHGDAAMRDGKKAIAAARKACQLSQWKDWRCIDTLAAAYAEAGNFRNAVKYQTQALEMTPPQSDQVADMKKRLELYQQDKPYREEAKH
jgi:tetratricopeptide (TPR) repeat protein